MLYKCGDIEFSVEQIDGLGKNPGLWVKSQVDGSFIKVASFGSKEKADLFELNLQTFFAMAKHFEPVSGIKAKEG